MDVTLEQRIARIISRRQEELSASRPSGDHPDNARRLAHGRVVSELPRLLAQISSVIAELNDQIADSDLWIKLDTGEHTPAAEAVYTLSVVGPEQDGPVLALSVDYTGKLRALLCRRQSRSLLESSTVFTVDRASLMNMLVTLLEAHYH